MRRDGAGSPPFLGKSGADFSAALASCIDRDRVVQMTQELIRIPSGTFEERAVAEHLANAMDELDVRVERQEVPGPSGATMQVVGTLPGKGDGSSILLCGHLDTWAARNPSVWVEQQQNGSEEWHYFAPEAWTKPPFAGEVEDGWIYGVGAVDQKAGIAAMLAALEALVRSDIELRGDVIVAGLAAEGAGGYGARELSSADLKADMAIITEFTNLDVVTVSVGGVVAKITTRGEPRLFPPRVDPVAKMIDVLTALGPLDEPMAQPGWLTFQPHPALPGYPRVAVRNISTALGSCSAQLDFRTVPGITVDSVQAELAALLGELARADPELEVELEIPVAPHIAWPVADETRRSARLVEAVSRWHEHVSGVPASVGAGSRIGAVSDKARLIELGIPEVLEYGPGLGDPWPMADERCRVDDIVTTANVLALASAEVCQ